MVASEEDKRSKLQAHSEYSHSNLNHRHLLTKLVLLVRHQAASAVLSVQIHRIRVLGFLVNNKISRPTCLARIKIARLEAQ